MVVIEGVKFRNPIVISSCPLTESALNIEKCIECDAGGIILKTAADYQKHKEEGIRRILHGRDGYWAQSTFEREIMTLNEAEELCKKVLTQKEVPIIASVAGMSLEKEEWMNSVERMERAGASMIQLDFFYLNNIWNEQNIGSRITHIVERLVRDSQIPIVPKININLPVNFIYPLLKNAGVHTVSLLDSVRVPVVSSWAVDSGENTCKVTNEGTSYFGAWQLPLTLSYLMFAKKYEFQVIAGGGIRNMEDVRTVLQCGADAVQIASAAMFGKYDVIREYATL